MFHVKQSHRKGRRRGPSQAYAPAERAAAERLWGTPAKPFNPALLSDDELLNDLTRALARQAADRDFEKMKKG
jgi:hypothetical protein